MSMNRDDKERDATTTMIIMDFFLRIFWQLNPLIYFES